MGYLLKEALKALCGVNQWSYAVFWRIGCQNPKLLIWEECYYHATQSSNMGNPGTSGQKMEGYQNGPQMGDRLHLLMDKMMMSNQVNMVGEGLVGRSAFTGNHLWIVSANFSEHAHPAEVLNELHLQFSAGMQTIAVIPVIPHGVVQLGSPLAIMENIGFVHNVRSLILQVGCVLGAFPSENHEAENAACMFGLPVADAASIPNNLHDNLMPINSGTGIPKLQKKSFNQSSSSLLSQFQDNLLVTGSTFMTPSNFSEYSFKPQGSHFEARISAVVDSSASPSNGMVETKVTEGLGMPLNPDSLMNQSATTNNPVFIANLNRVSKSSTLGSQPIAALESMPAKTDRMSAVSSCTSTTLINAKSGYHSIVNGCNTNLSGNSELGVGVGGEHCQSFQRSAPASMFFHEADTSRNELVGFLNTADQSRNSNILDSLSSHQNFMGVGGNSDSHVHVRPQDNGVVLDMQRMHNVAEDHLPSNNAVAYNLCNRRSFKDLVAEDVFLQSTAGDDLFDVLGVDFKTKFLGGDDVKSNNHPGFGTKVSIEEFPRSMNPQHRDSKVYPDSDGISESGVLSSSCSDHLLDAVITGVSSASRQVSEDNVSCRSTVSRISCLSVPGTPHSNSSIPAVANMSDGLQAQIFGISKPVVKLDEPVGTSFRAAYGKNDGGNCSLSSSTYGSQISSWTEQGPSVSISTANSKKHDESAKSNKKRLKPGENPRPRPKDRQMIQDRVKELRDIVPNGAKCSIDALLERTIKHMLFLQSVTKHADKLKHTVESKIAKKEGGLLPDDNFEGGATWAFELGTQSMVCPIVVEDLIPPRQLLIEMLFEERGLFLEIADLIRGLGLTILKGVMEVRNDKIWAQFSVEANRDVTRMEVFISLVHLLEQTLKSGTAGNNVHPASVPTEQPLVGAIACGDTSAR